MTHRNEQKYVDFVILTVAILTVQVFSRPMCDLALEH